MVIDRVVSAHEAADAKAGVGTRDEEEARAVGVADANVLGGSSLAREIRCMSAREGNEARRSAEKKARSESNQPGRMS